jgi:hypothetical protein
MRQFDKQHAATIVATAALAAHRFVAYDGGYATTAGGAKDAVGVTESAAEIGQAVSAVTGYTYLVEAEGALAAFDFVKPGTDGKAIVGTVADNCGRALSAAADGELVEVQILKQVHP